ncbi:hypothetical protein IJG98_01095 [Candidatus Saccharibacteria bacterium]|nr:hypothetical protein [Candidatus Saccharibacteria bacterium]
MPVNLGKTGNKPPVRVDVSPKPRADFSVRERAVATKELYLELTPTDE